MRKITEGEYEKMKQKAVELFHKNKKIHSSAFGEIRITPEGFNHIEWKSKDHKRSIQEAYIRYLCFHHVFYILNHSKLYQEFREEMQQVEIKKHGKKIKENKLVSLFGFVAIVNGNKNRVKVVVKKVNDWSHYEFVSVIPVWKSNGYSGQLFFEEDLGFLEE